MAETDNIPAQDMQASSAGQALAFLDVMRTMIRLHPGVGEIAEALYKEREETISIMLAKGCPDKTIDAYRDTIDSIRPHPDGQDTSPP